MKPAIAFLLLVASAPDTARLVGAQTAKPAVEALGPPEQVVVVLHPREGIPKLRQVMKRLGGDRTPRERSRGEAAAARIGLDLFDIEALSRAGVALDAPAWIMIWPGLSPVLELPLEKPERLDQLLARATEGNKDAHARSKGNISIGSDASPDLIVRRKGWRAFIQIATSRPRGGASSSDAIAAAERLTKPAERPRASPDGRAPDLALFGRGEEGFERVEVDAWVQPQRIELRAELILDFTTGLLLGDLAASPGSSAPLFDVDAPAAELTAFLGSSAITNALDAGAISVAHARALLGRFHVILSREGTLAGAAELADNAPASTLDGMEKAFAARFPEARIERQKRLLLFSFRGRDEDTFWTQLNASIDKSRTSRAPVELRVNPKRILEALTARARARSGPTPSLARLALARVLARDFEQHAEHLAVELSFGPNIVHAHATLELDAN